MSGEPLFNVTYLTGTMKFEKPKYRIESYEKVLPRLWWQLNDRIQILYRLVPDNDWAFVGMSNIDSYDAALRAKALLEH